MCTHSINLKEDKSVHKKGGPIKPPYLSTRTGGTIQGTFQIVQTNLNVRRGGRHIVDRWWGERDGDREKQRWKTRLISRTHHSALKRRNKRKGAYNGDFDQYPYLWNTFCAQPINTPIPGTRFMHSRSVPLSLKHVSSTADQHPYLWNASHNTTDQYPYLWNAFQTQPIKTPISETRFIHSHHIIIGATKDNSNLSTSNYLIM